jgi:hypothetical protein
MGSQYNRAPINNQQPAPEADSDDEDSDSTPKVTGKGNSTNSSKDYYANQPANQRTIGKRYLQYMLGSMIVSWLIFTLGVITPFMGWVPPIRLPFSRY